MTTVHDLTSSAMAIFCIQRPLPVQLIGNLPTLTLSVPLHWAELVGGLDLVGRPVFPLFNFNGRLREDIGVSRLGERRSRGWDFLRHDGWLVGGRYGRIDIWDDVSMQSYVDILCNGGIPLALAKKTIKTQVPVLYGLVGEYYSITTMM